MHSDDEFHSNIKLLEFQDYLHQELMHTYILYNYINLIITSFIALQTFFFKSKKFS